MSSLKDSFSVIADILSGKVDLGPVALTGWVRTRRGSKSVAFLQLNDGSTPKTIQVVVNNHLANFDTEISKLTMGAAVRVEGQLVSSQGREQQVEVQAERVEVYGFADPENYPLQKKTMTNEYLRDVAHLRVRTRFFSSMFRVRSRVCRYVHDYFDSESFFYVQPPIITASDCEGAGEVFRVTTLPLENPPRTPQGKVDYAKDFFGGHAYLTVSAQLEGELLALGLGKIYTFGPTFRAENSNTTRHLAEFWQIEPEMAFWNLHDTIDLGQGLLRYVVKRLLDECDDDLAVLAGRNEVDSRTYLPMVLDQPLVRLTYADAMDILVKSGRTFEYPVGLGESLQTEHERFLCEEHFKAPVAVMDYPEEQKSFYMYLNDDGKTVHAADILVPNVGEIIGSSQREHRYDVLQQRVRAKGLDESLYDWYLQTRQWGTVPHAGFGMGLERLLMWLTGTANVRDVISFPRTPGRMF